MTSGARFMLDTDTVSFALRGQGGVAAKLVGHAPSEICLSAMALSELRFGAERRGSKRLHRLIDTFVMSVTVSSFDEAAAAMFGRLCARLESRGKPIGILDTLIAAHAMALNVTLVTNNTKHFARISGLKTVNWMSEAV
jgi:tRNA(fMet)-specific endonuclease VapC